MIRGMHVRNFPTYHATSIVGGGTTHHSVTECVRRHFQSLEEPADVGVDHTTPFSPCMQWLSRRSEWILSMLTKGG